MTYTLDIPIDVVFFLFFVGGFIAGFATFYMIVDYARMRAENAKKYNCMGMRKPNFIKPSEAVDKTGTCQSLDMVGRPTPPKPLHPKK